MTALQDLFVQILNVSLMFSVGLEVDRGQLRTALTRWRLLLGALVLNFVLIPAAGLLFSNALTLSAPVTAGLMLAALCPGGGMGTLLTRLARGSLELSVVLLVVFTLLAVPIVPLMTRAFVDGATGPLDLGPMLRTLVVFQLAPLLVGGLLRALSPAWAERADRVARPLSNVIFAVLVIGLLIARGPMVFGLEWQGMLAMSGVVLVSAILPAIVPLERRDRAALSLTTSVRNLALALLLSTTFFGDRTTIAVLAYGLFMFVLGGGWAGWLAMSARRLTSAGR